MISVIFLKEKRREKEGENEETVKCIGGDNEQQLLLIVLPSSNTRGRGGT
jgi:hypothetical protein